MNTNARLGGNRISVLVVEDSPTQAMQIQHMLEEHGFEAAVAGNGREAIERLNTRLPGLVISDIQMPEMDGYALCRAVKSDKRLSEIPVILLTSLSASQDIIRGLECGADNFVVKPWEETFLLSRIQTVLANLELREAAGPERGISVVFAGEKYVITSNRRQILNLLLTTYETAVQTNQELIKAQEELKATQAQLIETEKLLSLGRLAAGVAHEVRNPLAIIEMGIGFLSGQAAPEGDRAILHEMKEALERANSVIGGLMDLSSSRKMGMTQVSLNLVLESSLAALKDKLSQAKILVRKELAADLPACRVNESRMEQVFFNVFTNACDAMPEGGMLTVRSYTKTLASGDVRYDAGDRSGVRFRAGEDAMVVEVDDTGAGVSPENLSKVFEPFFSTKPTGKGMGLGLTVAKKIVDLHGGKIDVRNREQGGVQVAIMLKCAGEIGGPPGSRP